jgi:hypothetical protein
MDWARILAYVTGTADQELLVRRISGCGKPHPQGPVERAAENEAADWGRLVITK